VFKTLPCLLQNLVWPWYTSSWALEQLGLAYQEAAELLAGMVCELYIDTHALIDKQEQQQQDVAASTAAAASAECGDGSTDHGMSEQQQVPTRMGMLDAAVLHAQQQLVQQQQTDATAESPQLPAEAPAAAAAARAEASAVAAAPAAADPAAEPLNPTRRAVHFDITSMPSGTASCNLHQPPADFSHQQQQQQGYQSSSSSRRPPDLSSRSVPDCNTSRAAAVALDSYAATRQVPCSLQQLLQQRRQQRLQAAGPAAAAAAAAGNPATISAAAAPPASSPLVLQGRLLKPLVQVSLLGAA
jgi:hypothetical protein